MHLAAGGAKNWPSDVSLISKLVEEFDPLRIPFDLEAMGSQPGNQYGLVLEPGYLYSFEAFVRIEPRIDESTSAVYGWNSRVVRQTQYRTVLDSDEKSNMARVRLSVSFDPTAFSTILSLDYMLFALARDFGSSILMSVILLFLLRIIRWAYRLFVFLPSQTKVAHQPPRS
jgi:hypothetical protein